MEGEIPIWWRLVGAVAFVVLSFAIGRLVGKWSLSAIERSKLPIPHTSLIVRSVTFVFVVAGVFLALDLMGFERALLGIAASGGLAAIVLGFAFKDIGENLLAGLMLAASRPFDTGDNIRSGDHEGTVVEIGLRNTIIRTFDGIRTYIPNSVILNTPLANLTRSEPKRHEISVGISYDSNIPDCIKILSRVVSQEESVLNDPAPLIYVKRLEEQFVTLGIFCWIDSRTVKKSVFEIRTDLVSEMKDNLMSHGVVMSADVSSAVNVRIEQGTPGGRA